MSKTLRVDLQERGYDIHIGTDIAPGAVLAEEKGTRALVVSDSNVDALYGAQVEQLLAARGLAVCRTVVPAGEKSKNLDVVRRLYGEAIRAGLDRRSVIVALGGGMVGDLAGFAAATYLRGIRFIQVPTTLLAMVDSSVGGKVGVNLEEGKNLVGAFHQPVEVCADLNTLNTLPPREYVSGLAEVVKYGIIWDAQFFEKLEKNVEALRRRDAGLLEDVIRRCCEIKSEVVRVDEMEAGVRAILNFGHTLGHALEQVSGYGRRLHGEAVAIGMAYAGELSVVEKGFRREDSRRLRELLKHLGLPVSLGGEPGWAELRKAMTTDKKARLRVPRFVLAEKPGGVVFGCEVAEAVLEQAFESIRA